MPNKTDFLAGLLKKCNPDPKNAGKTLLVLNSLGMVFAAICDTSAAAVDKNTNPEDKKFLIPAGIFTGFAKIGLYFAVTTKIINKFKGEAEKFLKNLSEEDLINKSISLANAKINRAEKGVFLGLGKKSKEYIASMKETLFNDNNLKNISDKGKALYKNNTVAASGVLGAFTGAFIGCAILTPIIRDISAYFVRKQMNKRNVDVNDIRIKPYLIPTNGYRRPLNMKNYMAFTQSAKLKI